MYGISVDAMENATTGFLLWRVTMKFRASVDRVLADLGLTHAQYSLLASLHGMARSGAQPSQRELADHTGLEPIFVSKLARALEQAGLVTRATHPADPRAVQLALTERGTAVVHEAIGLVRTLHEELTARIGGVAGPRNRQLAEILKALLGAAPPEVAPPEMRSTPMTTTRTLTGQDIGEAEGAVRALLDEILAGTGSTSNEYIVLRVLSLSGATPPAQLHEFLARQRQLHLEPPAVAVLLHKLEADGLVTAVARDGAEPVTLTERGAGVHAMLAESVTAVTSRLYAGLAADDLATTHRVLAQVVERAGLLRTELAG